MYAYRTHQMPDFSVSTLLTALASVASALGLKGIWDYWLQSDQQEHNQSQEWADRITARLDHAEERLDKTESQLYREQHKATLLSAQVQILIERIDQLLDRLEEHETITPAERESLTSVPEVG